MTKANRWKYPHAYHDEYLEGYNAGPLDECPYPFSSIGKRCAWLGGKFDKYGGAGEMTAHERQAREAIRQLGLSPAPMIELGALIGYINDGYYQRQYCEAVRDSLIEKALHAANKQAQRLRDAQHLLRKSA